ncbi:cupin domain-containing protein [Fulvimarina sp. MAC3]|uniref:cupin domain-containing protein n=1 Tax=Fulvimarina sp. MAC3 TaxID=3148887 RepID=UPI0031FC5089
MHADVKSIIETLKMEPHPEGGWYRETFRDEELDPNGRSRSTAIYYLLEAGDTSEWHRVTDASETWHFYRGAPLVLTVSPDGHDAFANYLGPDIEHNQRPQFVVPANWWQTATSLGAYTLVGCTVSPAFTFDSFEMAPKDWRPTPRKPSGR